MKLAAIQMTSGPDVAENFVAARNYVNEAASAGAERGIPPPTPAWGSMIADGRQYMRQAWWVSVIPGIAIFLVTASLSLLGDWLRDYFDPKLRQRAWE